MPTKMEVDAAKPQASMKVDSVGDNEIKKSSIASFLKDDNEHCYIMTIEPDVVDSPNKKPQANKPFAYPGVSLEEHITRDINQGMQPDDL